MNHPKKPLMLRAVAIFCLFFTALSLSAQVQTAKHVSMTGNTNGYYEYLPQGYNPYGSETYPLIIFVHGLGELGDGSSWQLPRLLYHGLPKVINQGQFPSSFNVGGQTHKFIVLSPQFVNWPSVDNIQNIINYAVQNYKVNVNRIYLTGLSMGGGATWEYVGQSATYANRIAAIVPVCGASWPDYGRARTIATANVAVWATHNNGDGTVPVSYTNDYVNHMNQAPAPNPMAKKTIFWVNDHDAWSQTYDPNFRENGMNVFEWMLQFQRGNSSTAPAPLPVSYVSVPGRVQAEAFAAQSGTQQETTLDAGGGGNLGYIDQGDWMDYNINPNASGNYTVGIRIAAQNSGGQLQIRKADGTVLTTVSIPATGGYQSWQTVNANLYLNSGNQTIRVVSTAAVNWNINYLEFAAGATTAPAPTPSTAIALPGKVEAEAFSAQSGTQNEGTSDAGGGQNVGYIDNGDWMDYSVNPTQAGTYTVSLRVASPSSGGSLQLRKSDGSVLTTVSIPNTGGYQSWQSVTATLYLNQGTQTIRLHSSSSNWNINYLNFTLGGTTTTPTPTPTPPSGTQRIEAEAYTAQSGTQKEGTQDSGGGENLGYIDNGDWMEYSVNVAQSATYTVSFRVASQQWGGQLQLRKADGSVLATVAVPYTSGWQTWQSVTASIYLNQGVQTLRIQSTQPANWNINYFELTQGSGGTTTTPAPTPSAGYTALPGKVEAESFSAQSGIQTEGTQDNGGGQNVGYIDYLDWMEYKVSPASAATYTLSLRIATPNNNAQLQLRKADGTVLTTVSLPNTGGYQSWQSVNVSVSLPGGDQTVRVVSTGGGSFNINYLEFAAPSASLTQSTPGVETLSDAISVSQPLEVFPNPIETNFQLKINNTLTGALKVEMINMQGVSIKTFNLQKSSAATSQFYLSASELPQGQYILKATMQNWEKTVNVMKN